MIYVTITYYYYSSNCNNHHLKKTEESLLTNSMTCTVHKVLYCLKFIIFVFQRGLHIWFALNRA